MLWGRAAVAQERGLEPPANARNSSNEQSCRIKITSFGSAAQDFQASFIMVWEVSKWPEMV